MNSTSLTVGRVLRTVAAIAILISGIVHLDLYFNGDYRFASPDVNFGRSILLNGFGAGLVAIALVARKEWFVKAAGIGYAVSTIAIFWYTHTGHSFIGFSHGGPVFDPSPQAQITVIMGIITILALAATFVPSVDAADAPMGVPAVGAAFAITAIALIGLTLKWKPDDSPATPAAAPTTTVATEATTATTAGTTAATAGSTAASTPDTTAAPSGSTAASAAPATGGDAVAIKNFKFDAADLTVAKGTTVTWTNNDNQAHTATSSGNFDTGSIAAGATGTATFDTAGTFAYICSFHPFMKGTITVTG